MLEADFAEVLLPTLLYRKEPFTLSGHGLDRK
jgi:hypothetical protein